MNYGHVNRHNSIPVDLLRGKVGWGEDMWGLANVAGHHQRLDTVVRWRLSHVRTERSGDRYWLNRPFVDSNNRLDQVIDDGDDGDDDDDDDDDDGKR